MVATNILPQNATDRAIAELPIALRDEARSLAWALFQDEGLTLAEATAEACRSIFDTIEYEITWDGEAEAARLAVEAEGMLTAEEPPHPASWSTAPTLDAQQRKAAWMVSQGMMAQPFGDGWLVPSGTRAGVVHHVSAEGMCSCEAGQKGKACWHRALTTMTSGELVAA